MDQQPSAILYQDRQEAELDRCEVDHLTVAAHSACREVNFKTLQFHAWLIGPGLGSSQICQQAGDEFVWANGLVT